MSQYLKRYVFLYQQLDASGLDDDTRDEYENEIDEIYYELDDEDLEYIVEKELEM